MFPPGFTCPAVLWIRIAQLRFRLQDSHLLRSTFPCRSTTLADTHFRPNPGRITTTGLASSDFARHYFRNLGWFLFLALLRCFSSGGSPHTPMDSVHDDRAWTLPDCSIRKSADIAPTYGSPQLIAVSHVLHRLLVPRHSPCALCSLTISCEIIIGSIFSWKLQ